MFKISATRIEDLEKPSADVAAGATVVFEGTVRNINDGHEVKSLEYEAMESLANKEGASIIQEAMEKFPVLSATCIHRVGHLQIGEIAIRVVVTAGHRKEAFAACQYIVDEVKSRVPIWKKEHFTNGNSEWIGAGQLGPGNPSKS